METIQEQYNDRTMRAHTLNIEEKTTMGEQAEKDDCPYLCFHQINSMFRFTVWTTAISAFLLLIICITLVWVSLYLSTLMVVTRDLHSDMACTKGEILKADEKTLDAVHHHAEKTAENRTLQESIKTMLQHENNRR